MPSRWPAERVRIHLDANRDERLGEDALKIFRRRFHRHRSSRLRFESLESRHLLSGTPLPFDDSGLAPVGMQAVCALPNLPVFNVLNYGAQGNGVADDTVAIRSALSAAEAAGGGIIYLPTGTYAVDPQASDPVAWGSIFTITASNIVFIGDHDPVTGATTTHLDGYVEGLKDPVTNWYVTGDSYIKIGRFSMFSIDTSAAGTNLSNIQFRSLDVNGQAGYTGDSTVGGNTTTGDGWDMTHKAIRMGGRNNLDNVLVFNCDVRNWRGEEIFAGGGTELGHINIVDSHIHGTNASAVSCTGSVLMSNSIVGGSNAGDDVYNGFEDYIFPGQTNLIENSTIMCSSDPTNLHGNGIVLIGDPAAVSLTVQGNTITQCHFGLLFSEAAHNVLVQNNTFSDNVQSMITSILGLYPNLTTGFGNFTISNNTFNSSGAAFLAQNAVANLALNGNTVTNGFLLDGSGFGTPLGTWPGFVVENNTLGTSAKDVGGGYNGQNVALWSNTARPADGGTAFFQSAADKVDDFSTNTTTVIRFLTDLTILNYNPNVGTQYVTIDPSTIASYPVGFKTTIYNWTKTNWVLKADPTWNTFSSDLPIDISPNGLTIQVNSQGLFELVTPIAPVVEVPRGRATYDGSPHGVTAIALGSDGMTPVSGNFSFTYNGVTTPPTTPGNYLVVATFTSNDPHYTGGTGFGMLIVGRAMPTIVVDRGPFTDGGASHAATATAVGIDGMTSVAGSFSFTYDGSINPPTAPGNYQVVVSFRSGDPDYMSCTTTGVLGIDGSETTATSNVIVGTTSTFFLVGSPVATDSSTSIVNNSVSAQGVLVDSANQVIGGISGTGNLTVGSGGGLTANYVQQNSLVISGSAGDPAAVTIATSDSSGASSATSAASANSCRNDVVAPSGSGSTATAKAGSADSISIESLEVPPPATLWIAAFQNDRGSGTAPIIGHDWRLIVDNAETALPASDSIPVAGTWAQSAASGGTSNFAVASSSTAASPENRRSVTDASSAEELRLPLTTISTAPKRRYLINKLVSGVGADGFKFGADAGIERVDCRWPTRIKQAASADQLEDKDHP
jgi:hypothetical protein